MPRGGAVPVSFLLPLSRLVPACFFLFCLPVMPATMSPADREIYEKLGLSEAEWGMVLDAHMPISKVNFLLKSGISISVYFKSPWKELGLSEGEWIRKRKSGLSDADIRAMKGPPGDDSRAPRENFSYVGAFFLPGCFQLARSQPVKGWIMSGVAVGMVTLCVAHSLSSKRFQPLGLCLLVPDMIWSGIDIGVQVAREQNPDASRFSTAGRSAGMAFSLQVTIQ
jgi:hypothetical protein